jgi:hypothetical protein
LIKERSFNRLNKANIEMPTFQVFFRDWFFVEPSAKVLSPLLEERARERGGF